MESYRTVKQETSAEFIEKRSKFIGYIKPVQTEEEAIAFIQSIKSKHWDATHNVYAYSLREGQTRRYSDDGEPQGTAGKPVLDVLMGGDIKNTAVVVTRYFGGTLLGTGGLVRAYGRSAKLGIEEAGIAKVRHYKECSVTTDYTTAGKIQYEITTGEYILKDTVYTDKVEFIVYLDRDNEAEFKEMVSNISMGKSDTEDIREIYGAWVKGKLEEIR